VNDPAVTPRNSNFSNDYLDFLGEYEAICETALARESGAYGGLFDEETRGRKSRGRVPLNTVDNFKREKLFLKN
jgi:hypothetical protein